MTPQAKSMAAAAGFIAQDDMAPAVNATSSQTTKALGMRLIATPLMPEGYVGLMTDKEITVLPPSGKAYFIPLGRFAA